MQKHQRLSIDERLPEMTPCETHPKKQLEYWCYTCKKLICIDCLLFNHKDHTYALKDDVAKELETQVSFMSKCQNDIVRYFLSFSLD